MYRDRRVRAWRAFKLLGLLAVFLALAVALPALALAASDESQAEASAAPPPLEMDASSDMYLSHLPPTVFFDNVESGTGSWSVGSPWAITTEWQPSWLSPGNQSWSDSPGSNYANNADVSLISATIDLSAAGLGQDVALSFAYSCALEAGADYLYVEFSNNNGASWASGTYVSEINSDGWSSTMIPVVMRTSQFKVRFRLHTNASVVYDGVHIDYIGIDAYSSDLIQEDDARAAYLGTWTSRSAVDEGGDTWGYKTSSTAGDLVHITFTGPGIQVLGKKGTDGGYGTVVLDGYPVGLVDFYSTDPYYASGAAWVTGYNGLSDGPHTLSICCTGAKNPASSGYAVSFEEAQIWGDGTSASPPSHKEQAGPPAYLYYRGPWTPAVADTAASGGSLATVDAAGSSVNVKFDGTYLAWNAKRGPGYGKAKVSVDAGPLQDVDLYYPWNWSKQRVFNTGLLSDGAHTLSIYWSGEKNAAATGTKINADSFDVYDNLIPADAAPSLVKWRYQETDSSITYLGAWSNSGDTGWQASGNSYKSTSQTGAAAVIEFTGTGVTPVLRTAPWYGMAKLTLDQGTPGEETQTIDLRSGSVGWKVISLYSKTGLADEDHTLVIENASIDGKAIGVDAFDITGYLDQAQPVTKIDDKDAACVYGPPDWSHWDDSGYWAAYEDTYAYTDQEEYVVTFTFDGTFASWVAATSNTKGKAQVRLYAGTVAPGNLVSTTGVDLFSPTTLWKRPVYSTGNLPEGTYHLVIECSRIKNPASWWYTIDVDRFDILAAAP